MASPYRGLTYPRIFQFAWVRWLWRRFLCPREIHQLDEVWSPGFDDGHSLVCDACDLRIVIDFFDTTHVRGTP